MADYITLDELAAAYPDGYTEESRITIPVEGGISETEAKQMAEDHIEQVKNQYGAEVDSPDGIPDSNLQNVRRKVVRIVEVVSAVVQIIVMTILYVLAG